MAVHAPAATQLTCCFHWSKANSSTAFPFVKTFTGSIKTIWIMCSSEKKKKLTLTVKTSFAAQHFTVAMPTTCLIIWTFTVPQTPHPFQTVRNWKKINNENWKILSWLVSVKIKYYGKLGQRSEVIARRTPVSSFSVKLDYPWYLNSAVNSNKTRKKDDLTKEKGVG